MQKFVEIPRKETGSEKESSWFYKCRREKIPFITVKTRTKLADVHWDYIAYSNEVDPHLQKHTEQTTKGAIEIFKKYATKRSTYQVSGGLVYFNDFEIHNARIAAADLYDLVNDIVSSCHVTAGD